MAGLVPAIHVLTTVVSKAWMPGTKPGMTMEAPMDKPLANRIALVTGASRGIGAATALLLARAGAHVVALARTVGGLEELDDKIKESGGSATLVPLDVRDTAGIASLATALDERYQRLDILIGNAGIGGPSAPLGHVHPKEWDEMLAVNVTANWHFIRFLDPLLQKSDAGRAVFISSGSALNARPYRGPYSVAKAALNALARTYAHENMSSKLRVNVLNPGPTRTRMRAAIMPGEDPMTLPAPEDVAAKIVELCLPSFQETGKLYDFPQKKLLEFRATA
jgi:NAD(P)-dependent dehydrogenase (short-subunit alcohol dehydrogenase family)